LRGPRPRSLSGCLVVGTPARGARPPGQQTVGYGVHRVFRVGSPCLAAEEVSLAPSPPPTSPERVAGREMGGRTRAKSWNIGFSTALRTLASPLARLGSSSRTFARVARECVNTRLRDPPDLRCRLARHLPSPSVQPVTRLDCLSWIVQRSPLRRPGDTGVHSRRDSLAGPAFGKSLPRLLHVPSSWFLTTSTVFASDAGRVSCNALPTLGFTPFSDRRPPGCPDRCASFPGMPSLPFEAFPPSEAACLPPSRTTRERAVPDDRRPAWPASRACRHAGHRRPCLLALSFPSPRTHARGRPRA